LRKKALKIHRFDEVKAHNRALASLPLFAGFARGLLRRGKMPSKILAIRSDGLYRLLDVSAYMTGSAMTAAFAPTLSARSAVPLTESLSAPSGAQNLLTLKNVRQNYIAEAVAVGVYALILAAALTYSTTPQQAPAEEPMELVMEAPPPAVEEPKPPEPEAVKPPEPEVEEPPPPPAAIEPAVAPVEPPKPKPKPKPVAKPVEHKAPATPRPVAAAPVRAAPAPAGATPSAIANQIHMRLARAAANAYPESQKPRSARISYRVMVDASGHITSFSITPSGNPAFDGVASRLGGRIGTVDPPGRPAALSGVINFAYR
jgi:outer membrane biosynthesis protein TonB